MDWIRSVIDRDGNLRQVPTAMLKELPVGDGAE
jgi:hypothetical protein